MANISADLIMTSSAPAEGDSFVKWLELKDTLSLLEENARSGEFVVYASMMHAYMHAVLVPTATVNPPTIEELMAWNFNAHSSCWSYWYNFTTPPEIGISPPLDGNGSQTIEQGEQLVFVRLFEGWTDGRSGVEILQKFLQVSEIHYIPERNAYCRLDKHGDLEDVVRIIRPRDRKGHGGGTIVTFEREALDAFAAVTDSVVCMMFDFTRFREDSFGGWPHSATEPKVVAKDDLSYRLVHVPGYASYIRGYQLVRPMVSKEEVAWRFRADFREEEKQFATFIIQDWRNEIITEVSCAPGASTNYFVAEENDLPFELSPAFFRPEVLTKYKANSEKYRVEDRSITCRGAWHLQSYDINEEGQVHAYLVHLRNLPYEEQLYWRSYNERPKGPISKRAFMTDFEASWYLEYDALPSLKNALRQLQRSDVPWWTLRSQDLLELVQYPATSSVDEWANEILRLDQLVVEGFEEKWLRRRAKELGRTPEPRFRSLKIVEECLIALGLEEEHARSLTGPLHETHNLRSKLKGHASGATSKSIRRKVLAEHETFRNHFYALCKSCDESIRAIMEAFSDVRFLGGTSTPSPEEEG